MKPVLSVAQMREVDKRAIGDDAAAGYRYMQRAGRGLFRAACELVPDPSSGEIAVVCGKGNNGGDGYVVGRLLLDAGYRVTCFSLVPIEELRGECLYAYREFDERQGNVMVLNDSAGFPFTSNRRLIIDALFGTGLQGDPHGLYAAMINVINNSGVPVLAVDTPSGLSNDTGIPGNPCITATVTVAMGFPKPGLFFYPGRELAGRLIVEDLDYPEATVAAVKPQLYLPATESLRKLLPRRQPSGSKFDHGQALLVGGSPGMAGSITLMAEAAMRCGCGMVHCAFPESLAHILSVKLTEPVLHALPQTDAGTLDRSALDGILSLAASMQALCIGPGLSHEESTMHLVREAIARCPLPAVLDADGLNAFKGAVDGLEHHAGPMVITPHTGEWERLFGALAATPLERIGQLKTTAYRLRATVLLKGNPTLLAAPDGKAFILPYGNSALAKAGSGDVLSGVIASLAAQGAPVADAAILGAYIHGTAGVIAAHKFGEYSVVARDVVAALAQSIRTLLQ
ncbi:MAG: NAD(P)H-hydrate dehydratase [Chitinispirillaceae bacterium]|nr:NAD(P)H-hydrate dehydratase [Chitinispirillaceae bacterium]